MVNARALIDTLPFAHAQIPCLVLYLAQLFSRVLMSKRLEYGSTKSALQLLESVSSLPLESRMNLAVSNARGAYYAETFIIGSIEIIVLSVHLPRTTYQYLV
jgi:hypothetical protein